MATVRAYTLAKEFDIDRDELIKRAAEIGIELRSAMVGVEPEQVDALRKHLGSGTDSTVETVEKRVGSKIIRRRKKAVVAPPEPAPEPVASETPAVAETASPPSAEAAPPSAEPVESPDPAVPTPEPAVTPTPAPTPAPKDSGSSLPRHMDRPARIVEDPLANLPTAAPATAAAPAGTAAPAAGTAPATGRTGRDDPAARNTAVLRRKVIEGQNLKEQETVARMARGNVQAHLEKRRSIVDQQSRMQPRRKKTKTSGKKTPIMPGKPRKIVRLGSSVSFPDLSGQMGLKVRDLLRRARALDPEIDRDHLLNAETATLLAEEDGFEVNLLETDVEKAVAQAESAQTDEDLEPRPPVVTVMGHVDHGKTSLLDAIRQANVVAGESGGITQHIGAYQAKTGTGLATFIDTPGHAAFTHMRARGAQITDIVVLVVAADDGVMPQTIEAINHARAASVPIIVAVNKIDRPDADPSRVKQALLEHELVAEEFGGDTICVDVSAIRGDGLEKLLEMLGLQAELLELKARSKGPARAVVIEAQLDRGRGPLATVLVQQGTLKRGDAVVAGPVSGRVRSLYDYQGNEVKEAGPSMPVQIVGLSGVPDAGEELAVVKNEREAKQVAEHRISEEKRSHAGTVAIATMDPDDIFLAYDDTGKKELFVVVKSDVRGTMEAIREALEKLSTDRVKLRVLHAGVGGITESDVDLALASKAVIIGFHVRPEPAARKAAERVGVQIRTFDIVYDVLDDATQLMLGLLPLKRVEHVSGHAEVRQLFVIPGIGTVAGSFIPEGVIKRSSRVRVVRDGVSLYTGKLSSLRRFKDDVREVQNGLECAMCVENFNDVKVGDIIEAFEVEETQDTL